MKRLTFLALAGVVSVPLAMTIFACGSSSSDSIINRGDGGTAGQIHLDGSVHVSVDSALLLHSVVKVNGAARTYETSVPGGYNSDNPLPLILAFHGDGGNGDALRQQLTLETVAAGGAIFLYPDATGSGKSWDLDDPADSNPDIAFFDAMLVATGNTYPFDPARVFVVGMSRGAYFSNQLGCRRGGTVRALASYEGGGPYENDPNGHYDDTGHLICSGASQKVAALMVNADDDQVVAVTEGEKSLAHWTYDDGCAAGDAGVAFGPSPCVARNGCSPSVVWCEITTPLGHAIWDQAAAVTWKFFSAIK